MPAAETFLPDHAPDHAARMDAVYRGQRHIYDLTRKYYLLGRDRLIAELTPPPKATVLEVGCGTGRNLVLAARRYADTRFIGLDISREMLASAGKAIERAGLSHRVTLVEGDAARFDAQALPGVSKVDRVFLSYTASMIPPWEEALDRAASLLAPGGALHLVDFGDQAGLPGWFRAALHAWLERFHVTPRAELGRVAEVVARQRGLLMEHRPIYRGYAQMLVLRA